MDLVLLLKEESRHGDRDVVASWAVWVSVLLDVLVSSLVGENLRKKDKVKSY